MSSDSESSGAWIGLPTDQRLILVLTISYTFPNPCTSVSGSLLGPNAKKKFLWPENESSIPLMPEATMSAAAAPLRAGMPPNMNAFSTCSVSRA